MEFILTENQLKSIIEESKKDIFTENMKILHSFVNSIISKVKRKYEINLKLLSTWGTSVGGLVLPLDNYIKNGDFNLDENQTALLLLGAIVILYFDNASMIRKIFSKIKEENLEEPFNKIIEKGYKLRNSFIKFLISLNLSIKSFSELISYSFLIPIIMDIQNYVRGSEDFDTSVDLISERLFASGTILVTAEILHEVIKKISNRLK